MKNKKEYYGAKTRGGNKEGQMKESWNGGGHGKESASGMQEVCFPLSKQSFK